MNNLLELGQVIKDYQPRTLPTMEPLYGQYCLLDPLNFNTHLMPLYDALCNNQDKTIWAYLPFGPFLSLEDFTLWLQSSSKTKLFYVLIDNESNKVGGLASYHDIDVEHGVIEVGAVIYSDFMQRSRQATEAMFLMMQHVFEDLGYRRYQWRCHALNQASRQAAQRLGFKFEGIFRNAHIFKGHNRDTAWYSVIDTEWPEQKAKFERWLDPKNFDNAGKQKQRLQEILQDEIPL